MADIDIDIEIFRARRSKTKLGMEVVLQSGCHRSVIWKFCFIFDTTIAKQFFCPHRSPLILREHASIIQFVSDVTDDLPLWTSSIQFHAFFDPLPSDGAALSRDSTPCWFCIN